MRLSHSRALDTCSCALCSYSSGNRYSESAVVQICQLFNFRGMAVVMVNVAAYLAVCAHCGVCRTARVLCARPGAGQVRRRLPEYIPRALRFAAVLGKVRE